MREIILDTETTGLSPLKGHRIVEIGCVEICRFSSTGRVFHAYLNPERHVPEEASRVHGLTDTFLQTCRTFSEIVDDFLTFIADAPLVIHNANFDLKFLNAELERLGKNTLTNPVTDTLYLARKKFPGSPASLDALCRRFCVDNTSRTKHGALLDAELLTRVYLGLCGGPQPSLDLLSQNMDTSRTLDTILSEGQHQAQDLKAQKIPPRSWPVEIAEQQNHRALLESLGAPQWITREGMQEH